MHSENQEASSPDPHPKVSVAMIAYNHEKYISQAIESVLAQETEFPFELVIGEDCSTDGTRALVEHYASKYPKAVRALLPEKNLGMHKNSASVEAACRGEYMAFLEGDDYWITSSKLAQQVEIMENVEDCQLTFTDAVAVNAEGDIQVESMTSPQEEGFLTTEALVSHNLIPSATAMVRRQALPSRSLVADCFAMGDWPTWVALSLRGSVFFSDRKTGAYRLHAGGVWGSLLGSEQGTRIAAFYRNLPNFVDRLNVSYGWPTVDWLKSLCLECELLALVNCGQWRQGRWPAANYLLHSTWRRRGALPPYWRLAARVLLGFPSKPLLDLERKGSSTRPRYLDYCDKPGKRDRPTTP